MKERRAKEKKEFREKILKEAKQIASEDGWRNVTIRKICDKVKYTAPVIYQYFESKESILQAIRLEGIDAIVEKFVKIDIEFQKPEERIVYYGLAWWDFAIQNPELYQVMYNLQGAICVEGEEPKAKIKTDDFYYAAFSSISEKAKKSKKYSLELCDHLIAIIHGFISFHMVNKMRSAEPRQVFIQSLHRFISTI